MVAWKIARQLSTELGGQFTTSPQGETRGEKRSVTSCLPKGHFEQVSCLGTETVHLKTGRRENHG